MEKRKKPEARGVSYASFLPRLYLLAEILRTTRFQPVIYTIRFHVTLRSLFLYRTLIENTYFA